MLEIQGKLFSLELELIFNVKETVMSITPVGPASSSSTYRAPAADGDSAAVEAAESSATKAAEQANGGIAPKAAPASAGKSSSSANNLTKLRMLASQHMSASQIAQQLGKSVSDVMEEAAAAGINLNADSTGDSSTSTTANPAIGNHVNVKV